jgi:multiple sugar transport system ATP-binding protein
MADIRLEGISKRWGDVVAVDELDLTIEDGSFTCLLGPSGCGKTTTLRMVAGLEEPTAGRIHCGQKLVYCSERGISVGPHQRGVGLIFQSYALWPHMTVAQNIAFGLEMQKMKQPQITERVREAASWMQIEEYLHRYPSELSGGQQQRVALARSLAPRPDCLLMDEPLSNLDAKLRLDMRTELKRIHAMTKMTILYVTHDQLEAISMATTVAVMKDGKLQQLEEPLKLYKHPNNMFVANFVGSPPINAISGQIYAEQGVWRVRAGDMVLTLQKNPEDDVKIKDGQTVTVAVRSEDILLDDPSAPSMAMTVYSSLPTGSDTFVRLTRGDVGIMAKIYESDNLPVDSQASVSFRSERILLFDGDTGNRISLGSSLVGFNEASAS